MKPKRQKPMVMGNQGSSSKKMRTPGSIELLEIERMLIADIERRRRLRRGSIGDRTSSGSTLQLDSKSTGPLKGLQPKTTNELEDPKRNGFPDSFTGMRGYDEKA